MADQLYPVFEIPDIDQDGTEQQNVMKAAPLFDYEIGDFVLDGQNRVVFVDGRDGFMLWVLKTLNTQLGACDSYLGYGIDVEDAMQQPDRVAVQATLERTITEALMENPATESVDDFTFTWEASTLNATFIVKPYNYEAFDVNMNVVE